MSSTPPREPPGPGGIPGVIKGRGATSNEASRYLSTRTEAVDDGWIDSRYAEWVEPSHPDTHAYADRTQNIIATNKSPDIPFSQSINPYKGCEHGCVYCFARPTHAFLDLSPGLDFETKIFYKTDPREHLLKALGKRSYVCSVLAMGTNTDPYQPLERTHRVMREIVQVLAELDHPLSIVTKSALVLRDLDLLAPMAAKGLVNVNVSVTTLDKKLKTQLEPRTASPQARLRTIAELQAAGIPVGAMVAPVIPFVNDHEIEEIVAACAQAGAQALNYILIRLPLEVKPLFEEWLSHHLPDRAERVMAAIRDTRRGRAYEAKWHKRMVGEGQIARLIGSRFHKAVRQVGLAGAELPPLNTALFQPPQSPDKLQLELF